MLQLLGTARRCCDGLTRRGALQAGSLAAMGGFGLPQYLQAEEAGLLRNGPAKNVIVLYLPGGAATQDMVDLKPHAPAEVRGEFKPISTNVPGIQICEHLPRMAQWAHRLAIVRSVDHKASRPVYGGSGSSWDQPRTATSGPRWTAHGYFLRRSSNYRDSHWLKCGAEI